MNESQNALLGNSGSGVVRNQLIMEEAKAVNEKKPTSSWRQRRNLTKLMSRTPDLRINDVMPVTETGYEFT